MRTTAAVLFLALIAFAARASEGKPVVGYYFEALCPYCRRYLKNVLLPLERSGLLEHVDFKLYPSGNAHRRVNHTTGETYLKCQHGRDECALNRLLGCMTEHSDKAHLLGSVSCVESLGKRILERRSALGLCMTQEVLEKVEECFDGEQGQLLFEEAYNATRALKVRHRWVPWAVVDDVPLYEAADSLPSAICLNIPKDERPAMCYTDLYDVREDAQSNRVGIPRDTLMDTMDDSTDIVTAQ